MAKALALGELPWQKRSKKFVFHDWPSGFHEACIFEEDRLYDWRVLDSDL